MAQFKKKEVRESVLSGAYALFCKKGYNGTSMADIASAAGVSASNIYVYFNSKLDILYAIYSPWLRNRLGQLEDDLAAIDDPETRLRHIFGTLWRDIPQEDSCFANNLMQALSSARNDEGYNPELLMWAEDRVSAMVRGCLPPERAALTDQSLLARVIFMAFDGFVMNTALRGPARRLPGIIDLMVTLLLGTKAGATGTEGAAHAAANPARKRGRRRVPPAESPA